MPRSDDRVALCRRRTYYMSKKNAEKAMKERSDSTSTNATPAHCDICYGWHIGEIPTPDRKGWKGY